LFVFGGTVLTHPAGSATGTAADELEGADVVVADELEGADVVADGLADEPHAAKTARHAHDKATRRA